MKIRLLDRENYETADLLDKMHEDHFYYVEMGLDKCLSYSSAKWLLESPKWFLHKKNNPDPETQALRDGRLVHAAILEPQKYELFNFVDTSTKNTKKWRLAVDQYGKANTFTMKEKYMNDRVVNNFLQNATMTSFLEGSETEVPGLITIDGIPFRGKADILNLERGFVADVKTTSQDLRSFSDVAEMYDYDMQAYLYSRMFDVDDFYFLVVNKITTDVGKFNASGEMIQRGRAKVEYAIELYKKFFIREELDLSQYVIEGEL